jgi:hypothetical protein
MGEAITEERLEQDQRQAPAGCPATRRIAPTML